MKKSLIIGASSLVLAAAPAISAFAASSNPAAVVDNLSVTVDEICTFTRNSGGSGATITDTMTAGALKTNFGSNTFKAVCNAGSGYSVAAVFTALSGSVSGSIAYSATTPTAGSGTWTATVSSSNIAASGGKLMNTSAPDTSAGTSATVTYKVSTQSDIAQGTYTGTATYTLTQK